MQSAKVQKLQLAARWVPGLFLIAAACWIHRNALITMHQTWSESTTFTHGYLIFPMCLFLIYSRRKALAKLLPEPNYLPAFFILGAGALAVIAQLMTVRVVEQLVFVSILQLLVIALYGWRVYRCILFPMLYMYFAVPVGEVLVPHLQEFTADFTVAALQLSGVQVFRDGMYFSIPAGDFEVAKACSGIRYLMASFSLGTIFAYLTFRTFRKQLIFTIAAFIVPIIANAIRAYGVVMIAHASDMKYGVGDDHIVYGWVLFGIVMFILFYVGNKFRDDEEVIEERTGEFSESELKRHPVRWPVVVITALALLLPTQLNTFATRSASHEMRPAQLPMLEGNWQGPVLKEIDFEPGFVGAISISHGIYERDDARVDMWVYPYRPFQEEAEMINQMNNIPEGKEWKWRKVNEKPVSLDGSALTTVNEVQLTRPGRERLLWYWYQLNSSNAASMQKAKLLEVGTWLLGGLDLREFIVVVSIDGRDLHHREALQDFVTNHYSHLRECLIGSNVQGCTPGTQLGERPDVN